MMTQLLSHIFYALFGRLKMYIVIFCGMADSGHVMFNFFCILFLMKCHVQLEWCNYED